MKRKIKVIIKANGGNDGMNTVIPIGKYSEYAAARPNLKIPFNEILNLDDRFGLHPVLTGFKNLFDDGKLSIINSVGVHNPDFSHFRAMDIMSTASDSNLYWSTGWVGRSSAFPSALPSGIKIGAIPSLDFQGYDGPTGLTITDPKSFVDFPDGIPVPNDLAMGRPAHIDAIRRNTESQSKAVVLANSKVTQQLTYPDTDIASQLKVIARLIAGGLPATTYMATMTGFDTHANQVNVGQPSTGVHAKLLKEMADAIAVFMADLEFLGVAGDVIGCTVTEFGREVRENGTMGTDHGHAAPVFVFGHELNTNRIFGELPDLSKNVVPIQYDFRQVYKSLLDYTSQSDALINALPIALIKQSKNKLFEIQLGGTGKTYTIFDDETLEVR